jgi:hypothetical protein
VNSGCLIACSGGALDKSMGSDLVESLANLHRIRHLKLLNMGTDVLEKGIGTRWCSRDLSNVRIYWTAIMRQSIKSSQPHPPGSGCDKSEKHGRVARALPPQPETITVNDGFFFKLRFLVLYGSCLFSTKTRVFHLHSGIFFKDHVAAFGTRSTNRHA